jgi:putative ubiquitin-RnfH superfamily antitoxin RatB of RatAB toxin-antitoxin module
MIKVTVDYGWPGCTDEIDLEVEDNATNEQIEEAAWEAGLSATNERIDVEWEETESDG